MGLLGYFLRALRADIGRHDGRFDRLEVAHREEMVRIETDHRKEMTRIETDHRKEMTRINVTLGEIREILASHTATLTAHSLQSQRVMDQGERAALEGTLAAAS